nr:immunoglobulin heavy chain junction region [Macaca mulatta]MOW75535.1 immunoglobulin heavy chain junction region [Macaca mulatta]MOW79159.1 immunoglobulin heavy chain junction region [Macaca mulatta]MOW80616.1 immunoglobulin heavy chain junction region [Macaca mulatta]
CARDASTIYSWNPHYFDNW